MKIGLYKGHFDPFTLEHLRYCKETIKKHHLGKLYIEVLDNDEDIAPLQCRYDMIYTTIAPYRKIVLIENKMPKINFDIILQDELVEYSNQVKIGKVQHLYKPVINYISEKCIYAQTILKSLVNEHRYNHSLSVAKLACEIATNNHLDGFEAFKIGIYHDIAKGFNFEEMSFYIEHFNNYEKAIAWPVWHQFVGALYCNRVLKIRDKRALKAIRHHCLGDDNDIYSKIVYIADKCEPLREYDSSKQIALAKNNIHKAFKLVKLEADEYINKTKK